MTIAEGAGFDKSFPEESNHSGDPMIRSHLVVFATVLLAGCWPFSSSESGMVGGPCAYEDLHGTCTFVDATGGAEVTFGFVSGDGSLTDSHVLVVGDGGTPPTQACLDELGITAGLVVGCTRSTLTEGTCSPKVFSFDDFRTNDCLN